MYAFKGDHIIVTDRQVGSVRRAEVVSVQHSDGQPPFWVRWSDSGEVVLWLPTAGAVIDHAGPTYPPEYDAADV
jgi:hypothetical protein